MSPTTPSPEDDLAFMRALVQGDRGGAQDSLGRSYVLAGLIYAGQSFAAMAEQAGLFRLSPTGDLVLGIGPTVLFLVLLVWVLRRGRREGGAGVVSRAIRAAFTTAGLANLALIVIIGSVAAREKSVVIWMIYPCVVFVLQGAAWLVAFSLRRRAWMAVVGIGWFASGIVMALTIGTSLLPAVIGGALLLFMVAPGVALMNLARREA